MRFLPEIAIDILERGAMEQPPIAEILRRRETGQTFFSHTRSK